jgi:outer membrane protein assembly factor BamB
MKSIWQCAVCTAVLLSASQTVRADHWPGWRGPGGRGITADAAPLTWSETENIAWRTPIPGVGRSSPIIWGDRVFLTTGIVEDLSRRLLAIDRHSGEILWNVVVHTGPAGQAHRQNTTASSTPTTDGERVYAVFVDDVGLSVVAVDLLGHVVWTARPAAYFSQHGFAASPVMIPRGLVVNGQQDGENAFIALLDCRTGSEIWRYRPATALRSFSTPVLIEHDGQEQLIVTGSTQTVALDPRDGRLIWYAGGPSEKFVSTPSIGHGLVFSFGGSPEKLAYAVRLGGRGDVEATHIAWRSRSSMPYVPSPLLVGDYLHVVSDQGVYSCLDPHTGQPHRTARKFGPVYSSPIAAAGRIYLFEDSGTCTVIENGPDFRELARNELNAVIQTTPAVSSGMMIVRTEAELIGIAERPPTGRWSESATPTSAQPGP